MTNFLHFQDGMPQYVSDTTTSDDEFLYERTVWASERLSLQMALDSAEHEIDRLKKELRSFRGRFNSEGFMVDADRDKVSPATKDLALSVELSPRSTTLLSHNVAHSGSSSLTPPWWSLFTMDLFSKTDLHKAEREQIWGLLFYN